MKLISIFPSLACILGMMNTNHAQISTENSQIIHGNRVVSGSEDVCDIASATIRDHIIEKSETLSQTSNLNPRQEDTEAANWTQRREKFLQRLRVVTRSLLDRENDSELSYSTTSSNEDLFYIENGSIITPQTDLMRPDRHFTIVTTASLPWMTGTAVNPLLRAAHLVRMTNENNKGNFTRKQWVTIVLPWLELEQDRKDLYPNYEFKSPQDQEAYLRNWLANEADMPDVSDSETGLRILFYPARYHAGLKSIFGMGDITSLISDDCADVCILEEPEHLNWYRAPGDGWAQKFHYVIGIVHTNYKDYASSQYHGLWTAPALAMVSSAMVRAYCHKVIKLSDVLQTFAPEKESTSNVHGVRSNFLKEGLKRAKESKNTSRKRSKRKCYFIGKLIWQKGLDILLDLQDYYKECSGEYFHIDVYGSGSDQQEIMRAYLGRSKKTKAQDSISSKEIPETEKSNDSTFEASEKSEKRSKLSFDSININALGKLEKIKKTIRETKESLEFDLPKSLYELRRQPIPATFPGRIDHALLTDDYTIFVNPSVTEVLCTTTAEALAMGKFAIIPLHPSNTFFLRFPNCLPYRNKLEFVANLRWAMSHDPEPMTPELIREFTWEAATERLVSASAVTYNEARKRDKLGRTKLDERIAWFHNHLGKGERGDALRKVLGAGPVSAQVKYQRMNGYDEDDEGFSKKFFGSSIARALRTTISSGLPSIITGNS
jgi:digalactosyldiacylglycerol synthase